jgi:hypothetical protein
MENHSSPIGRRLAQLQVDKRKIAVRNAQGRKACIRAAVEDFQTHYILIELDGFLHIGDFHGARRELFDCGLHGSAV